ncbi:MAG TPA: c-type cytochrome [Gemmatimonadales bacterium]|nr:c-type cytochrome [Gemmatimonadales bacterium]
MKRFLNRLAMLSLPLAATACMRAPEPGLARGRALYDTCAPCHGPSGGGNRQQGAPAIAGLPRWYVEAQLQSFLAGHRGAMPFDTVGLRMLSMARSLDRDGDVASVAEYVASMPAANPEPVLAGGNAQSGRAAFVVCSACHGAGGRGNEALHAPPLVGQSDWYLAAQLHKFKAGLRGYNPNDIWGATMRPNAAMLDDTTIVNVVAYIQTLRQAEGSP